MTIFVHGAFRLGFAESADSLLCTCICVHVYFKCVCVCVRERKGERKREFVWSDGVELTYLTSQSCDFNQDYCNLALWPTDISTLDIWSTFSLSPLTLSHSLTLSLSLSLHRSKLWLIK